MDRPNIILVPIGGGGGGGGSSYNLITSKEVQVETVTNTETLVDTLECGEDAYTSEKIIYVKIRDTAGRRNNHFFGADIFYINQLPANGWTDSTLPANKKMTQICISSSGVWMVNNNDGGVYSGSIRSNGEIGIYVKNASTGTTEGTFLIEVYALDWPDGISPFIGE